METLSAAAARRIALAAQGFGGPAPAAPSTWRPVGRLLDRIGLLQIDSVNVLARAHYLPLYSRLGSYPRALLEQAAWGRPRRLFEYWAHEASLLPLETHPLLRWRMARAERGEGVWRRMATYAGERRGVAQALLARIRSDGPLAASDVGEAGEGGWWGWSEAKTALEWLFFTGAVTTRTRRGSFERVYDLSERVIPRRILELPTPEVADAQRRLVSIAARALGVATAADLRDYFRLKPQDFAPRLAELVETGELVPVAVESWRQTGYLHRDARRPRRVTAAALLAPFDPLIWERGRTERLFGLRYRIEIYTPADLRTHGYYVLPFLLGDTLAARVDLKSDRAAGVLRVQSAHLEPGAPGDTVQALAAELRRLSEWLGLGPVNVIGDSSFAIELRSATAKL